MIPRIIHQIWVGPHPKPLRLMQTWRDFHPGFQFMEWSDHTIPMLDGGIQRLIAQMRSVERWHGVADIVRYEVLYRHGGFTAPADSECLHPIDDLLWLDCFACYENEDCRQGLVSPHLGVKPGNELMRVILEDLKSRETVLDGEPWVVTGNKLLTDTIERLAYRHITILPAYTFIPEHYAGWKYGGDGRVYARHYWGTTKCLQSNLDGVAFAAKEG